MSSKKKKQLLLENTAQFNITPRLATHSSVQKRTRPVYFINDPLKFLFMWKGELQQLPKQRWYFTERSWFMTLFRDLLVISRMDGEQNRLHSVRMISTSNFRWHGEKRVNRPTGASGKVSLWFIEKLICRHDESPKQTSLLSREDSLFRFYSNQLFVLLTPPVSLSIPNGCGQSLIFRWVIFLIRFRGFLKYH